METRHSLPQTLMKLLLASMLISPLLSVFSSFLLPPPPVAEVFSPEVLALEFGFYFDVYEFSMLAYFAGFWLTYLLLRRGSLRRAPGLWWCSMVFGVLITLNGALPILLCVVVLLKDRSLFYRPKLTDSSDGMSQPPSPAISSQSV